MAAMMWRLLAQPALRALIQAGAGSALFAADDTAIRAVGAVASLGSLAWSVAEKWQLHRECTRRDCPMKGQCPRRDCSLLTRHGEATTRGARDPSAGGVSRLLQRDPAADLRRR